MTLSSCSNIAQWEKDPKNYQEKYKLFNKLLIKTQDEGYLVICIHTSQRALGVRVRLPFTSRKYHKPVRCGQWLPLIPTCSTAILFWYGLFWMIIIAYRRLNKNNKTKHPKTGKNMAKNFSNKSQIYMNSMLFWYWRWVKKYCKIHRTHVKYLHIC